MSRGKARNESRLDLVQISVALDGSNGGEIFRLHASMNMAIYFIEIIMIGIRKPSSP